ncbi:MAG: FHA domain-containing protein, partial [Planctomycetota bacterium]
GSAKGMNFYLHGKSTFVVGSSPHADIYLADPKLEKEHFKIEIDEESFILTDLSDGKSFVNGEVVDIYVLQEGDHIRVGSDILAFHFRTITEQSLPNILKDIERMKSQAFVDDGTVPTLRVLEGTNKNMIYPLHDKKTFTIGRASSNDIKIVDSKISRHHCKIEVEEGEYILFDMDSTNGVFIRGEKKDVHPLEDGDHIRIGFTVLEFRLPKKNHKTE